MFLYDVRKYQRSICPINFYWPRDELDRLVDTLINKTDATGTWTWNYNPAQVGNLDLPTQVNLPNGTKTKYAYDGLERLTGVQNVKSDGTSILSAFGSGFDNINRKDAR